MQLIDIDWLGDYITHPRNEGHIRRWGGKENKTAINSTRREREGERLVALLLSRSSVCRALLNFQPETCKLLIAWTYSMPIFRSAHTLSPLLIESGYETTTLATMTMQCKWSIAVIAKCKVALQLNSEWEVGLSILHPTSLLKVRIVGHLFYAIIPCDIYTALSMYIWNGRLTCSTTPLAKSTKFKDNSFRNHFFVAERK